jgi:hypothetical protein
MTLRHCVSVCGVEKERYALFSGGSRGTLLSFEVSKTTYPMTLQHIPEEGDPELYHSNNLKTCLVTV